MADKKMRLGRGLAELLGEAPAETKDDQTRAGVLDIPITQLRPNPRQPRRDIDRDSLQELAESMRSLGIVQPIIARRVDDGYEIIAGERRWRAAQLAGFTVVPVILRQASDAESLEIALVENVVRRQLNPIDEAYALQVLLEDLGVTQDVLASRLGRSRPALTNKLRLLDLPQSVQELIAKGDLSEGHGRALLGLRSRGDQIKLAQRAVARGLSVRAVEAEVKKILQGRQKPRTEVRQSVPDEFVEQARETFARVFQVPVRIRLSAAGGKVEIPFRDPDELERITRRLSG